jgi:hypothetical protein
LALLVRRAIASNNKASFSFILNGKPSYLPNVRLDEEDRRL